MGRGVIKSRDLENGRGYGVVVVSVGERFDLNPHPFKSEKGAAPKSRDVQELRELRAIGTTKGRKAYWDLEGDLRRTMSAVRVPREMARVLPSPDHMKAWERSEVKWVSCLAGPPERGWRQTLVTPPRVTR